MLSNHTSHQPERRGALISKVAIFVQNCCRDTHEMRGLKRMVTIALLSAPPLWLGACVRIRNNIQTDLALQAQTAAAGVVGAAKKEHHPIPFHLHRSYWCARCLRPCTSFVPCRARWSPMRANSKTGSAKGHMMISSALGERAISNRTQHLLLCLSCLHGKFCFFVCCYCVCVVCKICFRTSGTSPSPTLEIVST